MSKTFKALIVVLFLTVSLPSPVYAADIYGINDLVEHAAALDGTEVTVTEKRAIGEAMERGEYAWVNLSDGTNAIGIWLPLTEAKLITYFGDYKNKGDSVRITGIFNRACADHGGRPRYPLQQAGNHQHRASCQGNTLTC